jgi:hypothetical protein
MFLEDSVMLKKTLLVSILVVTAVLLSDAGIWGDGDFYVIASKGPQGPPGTSLTPLQIAMLRWYDCSMNGQAFSV